MKIEWIISIKTQFML